MEKVGISPTGCPACGAWSMNVMGYDGGEELLQCEYCDAKHRAVRPDLRHLHSGDKMRYPYFNDSLGCTVTSRAHSDATAKKMGLVPAEWQRVKRPKRSWKKTLTSKD